MPTKFLALLALALLTACAPRPSAPLEFASTPRRVIIDTDMAHDDWTAVLYLLQRPDIEVIAVTVAGTGEAHCAPGMHHALELIQLAGESNIPVACGRKTALGNGHEFPAEWRTSVDALGGLDLPDSPAVAEQTPAPQLISELAATHPGLTILTLGPLTNLAEALSADSALAGNIEMVYIMGGAVRVEGNVAEDWLAEWNVYADPLAMQMVLDSGAPLTLVPLDATNYVPVTNDFYRRLGGQRTSPIAEFIYLSLTAQQDMIREQTIAFWDPLTASILADNSLATFETLTLRVEQTGPASGQTLEDPAGANVRVALTANRADFEDYLLQVLNLN